MPRRYEIVEEPEALEVIEDDVYNPDQSVSHVDEIGIKYLSEMKLITPFTKTPHS